MNFVANYKLSKASLTLMHHTKTNKFHTNAKFTENRREWNQMHNICTAVYFQYIAYTELEKIHTTKLTAYILDISIKSRCLDKPERSVAGHICGYFIVTLPREEERTDWKNGQFLFPDCLSKKKKKEREKVRRKLVPIFYRERKNIINGFCTFRRL